MSNTVTPWGMSATFWVLVPLKEAKPGGAATHIDPVSRTAKA